MNEAIEISQEISDAQARRRLEASQQAGHALLTQLWEARAEITRLRLVVDTAIQCHQAGTHLPSQLRQAIIRYQNYM